MGCSGEFEVMSIGDEVMVGVGWMRLVEGGGQIGSVYLNLVLFISTSSS